MDERTERELSTADMAAAGQGATAERPRAGAREHAAHKRDDRTVAERAQMERGPATQQPATNATREEMAPLFSGEEGRQLRARWEQIQTEFVDEPRRSVEHADALVAQVMKRLAEVFAEERSQLEKQWTRGDDVSTEDLRIALRRYRSFFDRLLAV